MTRDPFRALDPIDPPDQWGEIARRAASDGVDLEALPSLRPRRRAVALVAAAAAVALVAGGVVATRTGDDDGEDVTAATRTPAADMPGPCPFTVDPGPPEQVVIPGRTPIEPPRALAEMAIEDPDIDPTPWTDGSWGWTTWEGTDVTVSVYADAGTDLVTVGPWVDARVVDDARGKELSIIGTTVIETSATCRTVQVTFRAALADDDIGRGDDEIDLEAYGDQYREQVTALLGAVRLAEPGPRGPAPCDVLVDPDDPPVAPASEPEPPLPYSFDGETADGRAFTVEVLLMDGEETTWLTVEGAADGGGGGTRPDGPLDRLWSWTGGDAGIVVGWRPPEAVATAAVRPDGTLLTEGLVVSPAGDLYALPDVGQSRGAGGEAETWPIVHCAADGTDIDEQALSEAEARLSDAIDEEARRTRGELARCAEDPSPCPEHSGPATTVDMAWEGRLVDGRPYRVEVGGGAVHVFVDGAEVNPGVDTEVPDWPTGPGDGSASSVGFELSPDPDGGSPDWVLVGARPEGAVETWVRGTDGSMVAARTLTLSPDGRFFALHTREPGITQDPEAPFPVVHTAADGSLIELP